MTDIKSRIGYPCINLELQKSKITTNRHMIKKTFEAQKHNMKQVSNLALLNCLDLLKIVEWNEHKGIKFFRVSSNLFPWMSEYELTDLPDWSAIETALKSVGKAATKYGQRLTFHPGPFNVLASDNAELSKKLSKN